MTVQAPPWNSTAKAPKTVTFAGALAVANAIVTTLATSAAPQTVNGAGLNGAQAGGPFPLPRTVSVTTAAHAGSYKTGAGNVITVKGTDKTGASVQDVLTLTQVNGGETVATAQAFATVTEIDIPAENDALGSFTFGVFDVVTQFRGVRVGTPNSGFVHYTCQLDGSKDRIAQLQAGERLEIVGVAILGDTTAQDLTLGF